MRYLSVLKKKWLFKHFNSTSKLQNLFKISLYGFQLSFINVVAVSCWENTLLKACPLRVFCHTLPSCTCTTIVFLSNTIPPNGLYCIISLDSLSSVCSEADIWRELRYWAWRFFGVRYKLVCVLVGNKDISALLLIYVILSYSLTVLTRADILCALNFTVCTKKGKRNHKK